MIRWTVQREPSEDNPRGCQVGQCLSCGQEFKVYFIGCPDTAAGRKDAEELHQHGGIAAVGRADG